MDQIRGICDKYSCILIEDVAQGLYSKYNGKNLGSFGDYGCFSMGVTKLLTSGQGGFIENVCIYRSSLEDVFMKLTGKSLQVESDIIETQKGLLSV